MSSWRDVYPVHPAADIFPMMTEDELRDLGEDIKKNGLRNPITLWSDTSVTWLGTDVDHEDSETGIAPEKLQQYVLDGRNRLDAMELIGMTLVTDGGWLRGSRGSDCRTSIDATVKRGKISLEESLGRVMDPVSYVISANIKRRHLTKAQQADLIVAAVSTGDLAKVAKSPSKGVNGKGGGSTKSAIKTKAVEVAAENGISKRTVENALAKASDKPAKVYVTCPECSARTSEIDKHMEVKHKTRPVIDPRARKAAQHETDALVSHWMAMLEEIAQGISELELLSVDAIQQLNAAAKKLGAALDRRRLIVNPDEDAS